MIAGLRGWEWVIILVIVLLIFGVGRISKLAGELGKSISAFRDGIKTSSGDEKKDEEKAQAEEKKEDTSDTSSK